MPKQYKIKSPISIGGLYKDKSKRVSINRNVLHQLHFSVIAKMKCKYKILMEEQIRALPEFGRVKVRFTLHRGDNRSSDRSNICSEIDKFLLDAIVHFGKLQDDKDMFYEYSIYRSGEICKGDPHVMVDIIETKTKAEIAKLLEKKPAKKSRKK